MNAKINFKLNRNNVYWIVALVTLFWLIIGSGMIAKANVNVDNGEIVPTFESTTANLRFKNGSNVNHFNFSKSIAVNRSGSDVQVDRPSIVDWASKTSNDISGNYPLDPETNQFDLGKITNRGATVYFGKDTAGSAAALNPSDVTLVPDTNTISLTYFAGSHVGKVPAPSSVIVGNNGSDIKINQPAGITSVIPDNGSKVGQTILPNSGSFDLGNLVSNTSIFLNAAGSTSKALSNRTKTNKTKTGPKLIPGQPRFSKPLPAQPHYSHQAIKIPKLVKPKSNVWLHSDVNFNQQNHVATVRAKDNDVLRVLGAARDNHNHLRYLVKYNNVREYVTANRKYVDSTRNPVRTVSYKVSRKYVQPTNQRFMVKALRTITLHQNKNFRHDDLMTIRRGTKVHVKRCARYSRITRLVVNGGYITSNRRCVKLVK